MRLWSIHPMYLDAKGLTALWREALLARQVLEGRTKGYRNHPQLIRFRDSEHPLEAINIYLSAVYREASERGYRFNIDKLQPAVNTVRIKVTDGQLKFEFSHLLKKLKTRDLKRYNSLRHLKSCKPHPVFSVIKGGTAPWEKI